MARKRSKKKKVTLDLLAPRERRFANHYIATLHQLNSMKLAGYTGSDATLSTQASRLMKKPKIMAFIHRRLDEMNLPVEIEGERVLREHVVIGYSDITDFMSWNEKGEPVFVPSSQLHPEKRRAIESVTVKDVKHGKEIKFKLQAKDGALNRLGQYKKLWKSTALDELPGDILDRAVFLAPAFAVAGGPGGSAAGKR